MLRHCLETCLCSMYTTAEHVPKGFLTRPSCILCWRWVCVLGGAHWYAWLLFVWVDKAWEKGVASPCSY